MRVTICHVDARQTSAEMGIVTLFKGIVFCHISLFRGSEFMGGLIPSFFSYERIPFAVMYDIREKEIIKMALWMTEKARKLSCSKEW